MAEGSSYDDLVQSFADMTIPSCHYIPKAAYKYAEEGRGVVYKLRCGNCNMSYIGESSFTYEDAQKQIIWEIQSGNAYSRKLVKHFNIGICNVNSCMFRCLAFEVDTDKRIQLKIMFIHEYNTVANGLNVVIPEIRDVEENRRAQKERRIAKKKILRESKHTYN